jgi:Ca2+-binding EF-hand superfamily protein
MEKARLKKEIRFYGIVMAVCLILAAGINAWMSQGSQEGRESESLRSLKSELEQYRKDHGGKANREDLIKIWQSYEGKLSPEEIKKLKQDYRAKLDPAEAEAVRKAYEETKGKNP